MMTSPELIKVPLTSIYTVGPMPLMVSEPALVRLPVVRLMVPPSPLEQAGREVEGGAPGPMTRVPLLSEILPAPEPV